MWHEANKICREKESKVTLFAGFHLLSPLPWRHCFPAGGRSIKWEDVSTHAVSFLRCCSSHPVHRSFPFPSFCCFPLPLHFHYYLHRYSNKYKTITNNQVSRKEKQLQYPQGWPIHPMRIHACFWSQLSFFHIFASSSGASIITWIRQEPSNNSADVFGMSLDFWKVTNGEVRVKKWGITLFLHFSDLLTSNIQRHGTPKKSELDVQISDIFFSIRLEPILLDTFTCSKCTTWHKTRGNPANEWMTPTNTLTVPMKMFEVSSEITGSKLGSELPSLIRLALGAAVQGRMCFLQTIFR